QDGARGAGRHRQVPVQCPFTGSYSDRPFLARRLGHHFGGHRHLLWPQPRATSPGRLFGHGPAVQAGGSLAGNDSSEASATVSFERSHLSLSASLSSELPPPGEPTTVCPRLVATSPDSIACLKWPRSSRISCSGALPKSLAMPAPTLPAGGSYLSSTRTSVPRPPASLRKCTEPAVSTSPPGSERQ